MDRGSPHLADRLRPALKPDPRDLIAGVSVAVIAIPQALAYAELAGLPPSSGLYAAALPPIAAAVFASSPYLQTGPVAITGLLTFGALAPLSVEGSPHYIGLALLLAVVVGITRLAIGLLRAGFIANLMSHPVLLGFVPAAALFIIASQLPTALGADAQGGDVLRDAASALARPETWELAAIALSLAAVALMIVGPRIHRMVPVALIAVGVGILVSSLTAYDGATIGGIPEGLPPISFDLPWGDLPALIVPGLVIALVGFAEPASIARTYAARERRPWDANRELVSQGVANLVSGFSGGLPVGASFSRSALNRLTGAKTRLSGAVTGLAVIGFLPFASVLSPLPTSVLAAIVIAAVLSLVRFAPVVQLWRYSKPQFVIALVTFGATLALAPHVEWALLIGVGLAVAVHLLRELSFDIDVWVHADALHLKPIGVLWFGSSRALEDAFLQVLAAHTEATQLVVHLDGLGRVDVTGALALRSLLQDARAAGLAVAVENIPPRAQRVVSNVVFRSEDGCFRGRKAEC